MNIEQERAAFHGRTYHAYEIDRQLERGPSPGEDFFRLQVTGDGKTKWLNVTPAQLAKIADLLDERET